jgi:hypothetical protein
VGHHLAARGTVAIGWGGDIGRIGYFTYTPGCWEVRTKSGAHTHVVFRNLAGGTTACMHNYGAVSRSATNYMGYIGYNSGGRQVCPNGI